MFLCFRMCTFFLLVIFHPQLLLHLCVLYFAHTCLCAPLSPPHWLNPVEPPTSGPTTLPVSAVIPVSCASWCFWLFHVLDCLPSLDWEFLVCSDRVFSLSDSPAGQACRPYSAVLAGWDSVVWLAELGFSFIAIH